MTVMLGWWFDWVLIIKRWYERMDPVTLPPDVGALLQSWLGTGEGARPGSRKPARRVPPRRTSLRPRDLAGHYTPAPRRRQR